MPHFVQAMNMKKILAASAAKKKSGRNLLEMFEVDPCEFFNIAIVKRDGTMPSDSQYSVTL